MSLSPCPHCKSPTAAVMYERTERWVINRSVLAGRIDDVGEFVCITSAPKFGKCDNCHKRVLLSENHAD